MDSLVENDAKFKSPSEGNGRQYVNFWNGSPWEETISEENIARIANAVHCHT